MFRGLERIMLALVMFTILVSGFMVWRLRQVDIGSLAPMVNIRDAAKNYQERMQATQILLSRERF
ncbi:MAG: hypothetical protein ABIK44_06650 [candidate division WOR-3 bacterium]